MREAVRLSLVDLCPCQPPVPVTTLSTHRMLSTKLWFVTQVAMAITARPIMLASKTRHPNCSRIGIRILTIARHSRQLVCVSFGRRRRRAGSAGPEQRGCQSAHATGELQLRDAGVDGVGGQRCGCVRPIPRCEWCERLLGEEDAGRFSRCDNRRSGDAAPRETWRRRWCGECTQLANGRKRGYWRRVKEGTSRRSWGGGGGDGARRIQADGARSEGT